MNKLDSVAFYISRILSPYIVVPIFIIVASLYVYDDKLKGFMVAVIGMVLLIVPGLSYILIQMYRGVISSIHVNDRHQRNNVYIISGISALLGLLFLVLQNAPQILMISMIAAIVTNIVNALINKKTKISFHTATIAGCASLSFFIFGLVPGLILFMLAVLVGWSRVRLDRHTVKQAVYGGLNGFITTFLVAMFLFLIWPT